MQFAAFDAVWSLPQPGEGSLPPPPVATAMNGGNAGWCMFRTSPAFPTSV